MGTRLRQAQGSGDLRVALALSLVEGRAKRRRQPRAQWGSAGPLASTSWIAERGARRKRPALVVKGFLSEAIRRRRLAARSPLGSAEAGPRPWGRAWRRAVPGSRAARACRRGPRGETARETYRKVSKLAPGNEALRAGR